MPAGKVVGFLGGGQLGRMAALAAVSDRYIAFEIFLSSFCVLLKANMGVRVKFLDPTPSAPASVAAEQVTGDFRDPHAVVQFAKSSKLLDRRRIC